MSKLLEDRRVASVGTKDAQFESLLPPALLSDARVGRYWEPGNWTLPEPAEHVYFVGPWRLITPEMVGHALRRNVATPARADRDVLGARCRSPRSAPGCPFSASSAGLQALCASSQGARSEPAAGLRRGPSWRHAPIGRRRPRASPGRTRLPAHLLERVFKHMLRNRPASPKPVSGRIVLVCGNLAPGGAERQVDVYRCRASPRAGSTSLCSATIWLAAEGIATTSTCRRSKRRASRPGRSAAALRSGDIADMPSGLREVARLLPPGLAADIANLCHEFLELRPEVVHTWLDWDNVRGGLAAALAGVPRVVVSGRNINPSNFALYQPYMDPAYRVLAGLA